MIIGENLARQKKRLRAILLLLQVYCLKELTQKSEKHIISHLNLRLKF